MQLEPTRSLPEFLIDEELLSEIKSIPDKMAFKIGEVADMLGVKQYVLRYWESEFDTLKPKKSKTNQRIFTKKDVETAYLIRKLLHRDRFSIEGARSVFKDMKGEVKKIKSQNVVAEDFQSVQDQVGELLSDLQLARAIFE